MKGRENNMKILADKYEFAKMIRECQKIRDRNCGRCQCVLQEICQGQEDLEDCVEITEEEVC